MTYDCRDSETLLFAAPGHEGVILLKPAQQLQNTTRATGALHLSVSTRASASAAFVPAAAQLGLPMAIAAFAAGALAALLGVAATRGRAAAPEGEASRALLA